MRRGVVITSLVTSLAAGAAAVAGPALAAPASAATGRAVGLMEQAGPRQVLPARGGTVDSLNWSGYVVDPGRGVSEVTSTFTVPSASLLPPGFAATWAGIGGYKTTDLIQAGVAEDSLPSLPLVGPQYYAWYEVLPNAATPLTNCTGDASCTVAPGDAVTVTIAEQSASNTWKITVQDHSTSHPGWTSVTTVKYASSGSSAEWILEAPQLAGLQTLMAPLSIVHFGPTSTFTTASGATTDLAAGAPTKIDQSLFGVVPESTPSSIASDEQSFNDCTYTTSCPAP